MEMIWVEGDGPGFEYARAVRKQVFVDEQGFSAIGEFDEQDKTSAHIVGMAEQVPVCTARMFDEAPGVKHVGRVAVLSHMRGGGLGLAMIERLAERARSQGAARLVLNAQKDKTAFYERAGFASTGKTEMDEGVLHVEMILML